MSEKVIGDLLSVKMLFSISISIKLYNIQHVVVFQTLILKMYLVTFELILIVNKIRKARNESNLLYFCFLLFFKFF